MRKGGSSPLVAVGSPEKVIEDLQNDGDATARMAAAALTARSQSARKSPREEAWRVIYKTVNDCSWLLAQICCR